MEVSGELLELYEDKDGARKEEIQLLSGPNEFGEFYNRLKTIKEFHRKHPNEVRFSFFFPPLFFLSSLYPLSSAL
jgi:splicing factor 3A subunit 3